MPQTSCCWHANPNEINALSGSFSSIYLAISQPLPMRGVQINLPTTAVVVIIYTLVHCWQTAGGRGQHLAAFVACCCDWPHLTL